MCIQYTAEREECQGLEFALFLYYCDGEWGFMMKTVNGITSAFALIGIAVLVLFSACGGAKPKGPALDLTDYIISFEDNFDGAKLDTTYWTARNHLDTGSPEQTEKEKALRRGGYWDPDQVFVENGNLIIRTEYKSDGKYGAGYYTGIAETPGLFEQRYGYFEVRAKLPAAQGMWAAFWLLCDGMRSEANGGLDGAEIDIFESPNYHWPAMKNTVTHAVHADGYGDKLQSKGSDNFKVPKPYTTFNTYGLLWTADEYIFYINGKESWRTGAFGPSRVPEYMMLSCEVEGKDGKPYPGGDWTGDIEKSKSDLPADFVIDYVKVWKRAE
jgi:beta-glucanase (GH16 family)